MPVEGGEKIAARKVAPPRPKRKKKAARTVKAATQRTVASDT